MAKSTRSKVKRSFRHKKREEGAYAAAEAARLQRLNAKLAATASLSKEENDPDNIDEENMPGEDDKVHNGNNEAEHMDVDVEKSKRISTHGPRNSRREEWWRSKGLTPRPSQKGMNRRSGVAARSGRFNRRRRN